MPNTLMIYPSDFTEPVQLLYKHVSGDTSVTRNTAIHAAYQVVGAGLGRFVPDPDSGSAGVSAAASKDPDAVCCDDDTCCCDEITEAKGCEALKNCCDELSKPGVRGLLDSALFKQVMAFAMQKLMEWLVAS